jgi:flavin-dependent dehydrogenase
MYDVVVAGAGVAGSYLASKLQNLDILVLEKDKKTRLKDSGIVSKRFNEFFNDKKLIKAEINEMKFVSPSNYSFCLKSNKSFAYILKRKMFSRYLRKRIKDKIKYEFVRSVAVNKRYVVTRTDKNEYKSKMLIAADGAFSSVRRSLNMEQPKTYLGMFSRSLKETKGPIKIFLNKKLSPDFFAWTIPQNKEYGLITSSHPKDRFEYFRKINNFRNGKIHAYPIPIGFVKTYCNRILFVGDAASQTKPISGGGIIFSLKCSDMACDAVQLAFKKNRFDENFLNIYEKTWKSLLGHEIKKQIVFRNVFRVLSNKQIDEIFEKFGADVEAITTFDYDYLSNMLTKISKIKLIKYLLRNLRIILGAVI